MADDEKAKLYKQIVQRADPYTLLYEMRELGFWPHGEGIPEESADARAERYKIEQELEKLRRTQSVVKDPERALAEERKRRWEESKKRRAESKKKRAEAQKKRREAYLAHKKQTVVHAGVGVSYGLEKKESDAERLLARGLPIVSDGAGLAKLMGIPLGTLRWLTFHRRGAALVHYRRFGIPKKSGGVRSISAPKKKLAAAQRWVFERVLMKLAPEPEAHGFVSGRSIMSNAAPHVGRAVVINLDLKDFFPSITFRRVKGLFRAVGYSEHAATLLGLLCTEPPRVEAELDGKSYYVALGERILPQGASTSPAITNALCRRLDRRLAGLAKRHGFSYTRYADDLTFSGQKASAAGRLLKSVRGILADEGFVEHPSKTKVMRRARRQEVTGLVVNAKPAVDRREVRKLRAILHNAEKHGLKSQNRDNHPDFRAHLIGRVGFVAMVDPERAAPLKAALERVLARS